MGSDGDFQPVLPQSTGKQLSRLSPLYTAGFGELEDDKLELRQLIALAQRRALLIAGVGLTVTSANLGSMMSQTPKYEGRFQLLVGSTTNDDKLDQLSRGLASTAGISAPTVDYETQIKVLWSPQVISPILEDIHAQYPEIDYSSLVSKLSITRLGETKILEISFQDSDPQKIQFVLEQVAKGYVNYSQEQQQTSVRNGIQFVEDQLKEKYQRVDKLQKDLEQFRKNYNLIDPQTQGQFLSEQVSTIVQQKLETQTKLRETESLYTSLQTQLQLQPNQAITAAVLSEAPRYQQLLTQLQEIESKIATESARLTSENPLLETLKEQRENLLPLLREEAQKVVGSNSAEITEDSEQTSPSSIRLALSQQLVDAANQIQVLKVRNQAVAQAEGLMGQQLKDLAAIARYYTDLQRELQVATESLNRLLAYRETLQIEKAQKANPWQQISEPKRPQIPISPNIPRSIPISLIAGLLAGAGAAFLVEKLDNVFHSPEELKDRTGLPILGMIPFNKQLIKRKSPFAISDLSLVMDGERRTAEQGVLTHAYTRSPFLEAFRSLHASVHFSSPDQPIRSLTISSAVPADGKSTVATNLAQAAAAIGQRVLLVDADLRIPQIHKLTDLPNVWGLSHVITTDMNVDDVIQRSPLDDNLFVLTAGQIPPDPTRLLSSKKMQNLIKRFQDAFDLVIYDTPPLLGLADTKFLAPHTDGIVMVVGLGRTDRSIMTQVLDGLKTSHASVLGLVANGTKGYTTSPYDYYHRYYAKAPSKQQLKNNPVDRH